MISFLGLKSFLKLKNTSVSFYYRTSKYTKVLPHTIIVKKRGYTFQYLINFAVAKNKG